MLEGEINKLLALNQTFDGALDIWTLFVDLLDGLKSLSDHLDMALTFKTLFEHHEEEIDLVLIIVNIAHLLQSLNDVAEFLVELFCAGTNAVKSSRIQVFNSVTELVKMCVEVRKLVLRVPLSECLLAFVCEPVDLLEGSQDFTLELHVLVVLQVLGFRSEVQCQLVSHMEL